MQGQTTDTCNGCKYKVYKVLWDKQGEKTAVVPPGWKLQLGGRTKTLGYLDATLTRLGQRGQNRLLKSQLKATVNCFAAVFPQDLDVKGHFLRMLLPEPPTVFNASTAPTFYIYESLLAQEDVSSLSLLDVKQRQVGRLFRYVSDLNTPFIKSEYGILNHPTSGTLYNSKHAIYLDFEDDHDPTADDFRAFADQTLFPTFTPLRSGQQLASGQPQQSSHFAVTSHKLIRAPPLLIFNGMDIKSVPKKISFNHLASKTYRSDMLIAWCVLKAIQVEYKEEEDDRWHTVLYSISEEGAQCISTQYNADDDLVHTKGGQVRSQAGDIIEAGYVRQGGDYEEEIEAEELARPKDTDEDV